MQDYFSLVSSLATLRFDAPPPVSLNDFLAGCADWLEPGDLARLELASLDPDLETELPHDSTARRFMVWDTQLRNLLATRRQADLKLPPGGRKRPEEDLVADLPEAVNRALQNASPSDAAREIDLLRWRFLDDLEALHAFDVDFLCVYKLKLALLEKWRPRRPEDGKERFAALLDAIENKNSDSQ